MINSANSRGSAPDLKCRVSRLFLTVAVFTSVGLDHFFYGNCQGQPDFLCIIFIISDYLWSCHKSIVYLKFITLSFGFSCKIKVLRNYKFRDRDV